MVDPARDNEDSSRALAPWQIALALGAAMALWAVAKALGAGLVIID